MKEKEEMEQVEKEIKEKLLPLAKETAEKLEREGLSNGIQFKVFTALVECFLEEHRKSRSSEVVRTSDGKAFFRLEGEDGEAWIPLGRVQCP